MRALCGAGVSGMHDIAAVASMPMTGMNRRQRAEVFSAARKARVQDRRRSWSVEAVKRVTRCL